MIEIRKHRRWVLWIIRHCINFAENPSDRTLLLCGNSNSLPGHGEANGPLLWASSMLKFGPMCGVSVRY